jgi:hypothetical protein
MSLVALSTLALCLFVRGATAFARHHLVAGTGPAAVAAAIKGRHLSSARTMLSSENEGTSLVENAVVGKVKGPKGGYKPPIFGVPPERRLFDAEQGCLLHEVR